MNACLNKDQTAEILASFKWSTAHSIYNAFPNCVKRITNPEERCSRFHKLPAPLLNKFNHIAVAIFIIK